MNRILLLSLVGSLLSAEARGGTKRRMPCPGVRKETPDVSHASPEVDLKTDLLYDATASVGLGLEFGIGRRWTMDLAGSYNAWTFGDNRKWKHWLVQPALRFWTAERLYGHFLGLHVHGGEYNLNRMRLPFGAYPSTTGMRYEGWGAGAGVSYGYRWNFSERWGMEGEIGFGCVYSAYATYRPERRGVKVASGEHLYVGPTKIALNLIYRFGRKRRMSAGASHAPAHALGAGASYGRSKDTASAGVARSGRRTAMLGSSNN